MWQNPTVAAALADWDFGTAFRLIRQIASLRQEDMSAITGLSQSFLSTLESGARRLVNIDKIVPVLERLGVPPASGATSRPGFRCPVSAAGFRRAVHAVIHP
ncbi:helix-turn-helix domain-containing protein [Streptomyces alanosinicus]|uniref:helix-turn-helix domain-containing protein n=1 Tax=Streptomyces alanosinicus TaxID=68171 RepID=UPI00167476CC